MSTTRITRAILNLSAASCVEAFESHDKHGEGASTIACGFNWTVREADAAIDAGRDIAHLMARTSCTAEQAGAALVAEEGSTADALIDLRAAA